MWLLAGLGNPGRKYEKTRHNIGFCVADELVRRHTSGGYRSKFGGEAATGLIGSIKFLALKPMEFMNNSGFAIQRAAQYHDISPEKIVVIHDEIDLEFGRLRLKSGGGHGGHNGLRSIIDQLGSKDFLRIRVGVGKPQKDRDDVVISHVLGEFSKGQEQDLDGLINRAADAAEAILKDGMTSAMNSFNGATTT